jgi:(p)ppGpp synthase/HD superfamily hydrolase
MTQFAPIRSASEAEVQAAVQAHGHDTEVVRKALEQAKRSHESHRRLDDSAQLEDHVYPVLLQLYASGEPVDEHMVIVTFLHDTVEDDLAYSESRLRADFGDDIADSVMLLTKSPEDNHDGLSDESYFAVSRKVFAVLQDAPRSIRTVKLSDRLQNISALEVIRDSHPKIFQRYVPETRRFFVPLAEATSPVFAEAITRRLGELESLM